MASPGPETRMESLPQSVLDPASKPEPTASIQLPFIFAKRYGVLLCRHPDMQESQLVCREDTPALALIESNRFLGHGYPIEVVSADSFARLLQQSYEQHSGQTIHSMESFDGSADLQSVAEQLPEPEDLLESDDDAPIIRLINALFTEAVKSNASDIHIEPFENRLTVRMRIDGVLREVLASRHAVAPLVVSRVKVMAKLDIAEKRLPQDGRISLRLAGRAVDVRVSTIPSSHGERVVLRLLDKQAGRLDLEQLGMPGSVQQAIHESIQSPHGIILVTGPTGSGKTTTLYAALMRLNDRTRNIMTVEDPI